MISNNFTLLDTNNPIDLLNVITADYGQLSKGEFVN